MTEIIILDNVTYLDSSVFYNSPSLVINCEATSQPAGWDIDWNIDNNQVNWNYVLV